MRYEEYNPEHPHQRNADRQHQNHQEPWQERRFHDARSRWEEPSTPYDLRRNAWHPEQESRFKTEGQYHQQNQHRGQQHPDFHNQQQERHHNQHRDWQQHNHPAHRNNIQQATDRWQEHDWQPQQHNQERRQSPPNQHWNEQGF